MTASTQKLTPVRAALKHDSEPAASVKDGLAALNRVDRNRIDDAIRGDFGDSVDIDAALRAAHEQENRWDYLLGHTPSGAVVGVEPRSAKQGEILTIIKKRIAAIEQLKEHLKEGATQPSAGSSASSPGARLRGRPPAFGFSPTRSSAW